VFTALVFSLLTIALTSATLSRVETTDPQTLLAKAAFYIHIDKVETRNVTLIMTDYVENATLTVSGSGRPPPLPGANSTYGDGLAGTYSGLSEIAGFYRASFAGDANVSASLVSISESNTGPKLSVVDAVIILSGLTGAAGEAGSRIDCVVHLKQVNDEWSIASESWSFVPLSPQHIPSRFY
jgi:hypothetical protein